MKKTRMEKGITLVALIITIVVLLILAVVSIGAVRESGIIAHAQNAAIQYNQAQATENDSLKSYEDKLKEVMDQIKGGNGEYCNYTVKEDLDNIDLTSVLGEYDDSEKKWIWFTNEQGEELSYCARTHQNKITFYQVQTATGEENGYHYDFVEKKWYDFNNNEIVAPEIKILNARMLSSEEMQQVGGGVIFSDEIINAIFTITPVE